MRNYYRVSIAFLVLALGCGQYVTPNATEAVNTPTSTPIITVTPTTEFIPTLIHTTEPPKEYIVIAVTLNVWCGTEHAGYLHEGDKIACHLSGDWCYTDDGLRVWAGCLDAGTGKGCK